MTSSNSHLGPSDELGLGLVQRISLVGTLGDGPATLASAFFVHRRMLRKPDLATIA
jgi:hypothetical protein